MPVAFAVAECLAIRVARRINSFGVLETMAAVMLTRGVPEHIRSDNGAEMTAKIVRGWLAGIIHGGWRT
jgi:putative transposase